MPLLSANPESVATAEGARVTTTVYVVVATRFCAVTTVVIVFGPTARAIGWLSEPDITVVPFTFTVAGESVTMGVTMIDDVAFDTFAV